MCLKFGFVIFWQKDIGAKAAHEMLVKLTPGYPTMAARDEVIPFTRAHAQQLEDELNASRILH
jgi:hypothetical protein